MFRYFPRRVELHCAWLSLAKSYIFNTNQTAGRSRRLLILDSHSSHINLQFIEQCDQLRILLMVLAPHSTNWLQPLDRSLFAPLARYNTNELNDLLTDSFAISVFKSRFRSIFWPAWQEVFSLTISNPGLPIQVFRHTVLQSSFLNLYPSNQNEFCLPPKG